MSKIRCYKCKGKGEVTSPEAKFVTAITVGLLFPLLFTEKDECNICDGKGYLDD